MQTLVVQEETKGLVATLNGHVEDQGSSVKKIEQGVCEMIPDLHATIEALKAKLKRVTLYRDQQEAKTAKRTTRINALEREIRYTEKERDEYKEDNTRLLRVIEELKQYKSLSVAIEHAKWMADQWKEATEEMRAEAKRQRVD